ncbi:unnamed protein product [Closterium sp. NIES-64]|nr:unnamed protein product [Closterium sp. NIES-64]
MWSWQVKRERSPSPHAASLLPFSTSLTISVSHQAICQEIAQFALSGDSSGRRGSHRWRVRVAAGSAGGSSGDDGAGRSRGSDGASRPLSAPVPPLVVPSPAAAAAAGRGQHAGGADRDDGSATPGRGAAAALNQAETASEPPPHGGSTTAAGREGAGANARAESGDCIADEAAEAGPDMGAEAEGGSSARFRETLQMVETAMLAATSGLAFFLANSLRVEGYLGFFFPLPAVVASMRWGATAGLRTAISAAFLLLVLAGPIKAITFLLLHGFLGSTLGLCWGLGLSWPISILACTFVRAAGAVSFVLLSSWLIRENILKLILMNVQASLSHVFAGISASLVPSFSLITVIFTTLLLFNSASFSLLLHILYTLFLRRLGIATPTQLPNWMERGDRTEGYADVLFPHALPFIALTSPKLLPPVSVFPNHPFSHQPCFPLCPDSFHPLPCSPPSPSLLPPTLCPTPPIPFPASPHPLPCSPPSPSLLPPTLCPAPPHPLPCSPPPSALLPLVPFPASPHPLPCFSPSPSLLPPIPFPASPHPLPCFPPSPSLLPPIPFPASPHPLPCFPPSPSLLPPTLCPAPPHPLPCFPHPVPCFSPSPSLLPPIPFPASPHPVPCFPPSPSLSPCYPFPCPFSPCLPTLCSYSFTLAHLTAYRPYRLPTLPPSLLIRAQVCPEGARAALCLPLAVHAFHPTSPKPRLFLYVPPMLAYTLC